jgi:hypothetical protein
MAIIECINPSAGEGYDPNRFSADEDLYKLHDELAHVTSYEGCVLRLGEHNGYDDSDFYAMVWDEPTNSVKKITYATTRGWTYHNGAKVDATEDNRAKAEAYEGTRLAALFADEIKAEKLAALKELKTGVEVRSLTTRGKNKGVVGYVQKVIASSYGPGFVAGIQVEGEDKIRWIDTERVERTDFPADERELHVALALTDDEHAWVARKAHHRAISNLS